MMPSIIRVSQSRLLSNPAVFGASVPHAEFARLRRAAPVAWVDEVPLWRHSDVSGTRAFSGTGYWAVTRHATVTDVSHQPERFSSSLRGAFLADPKSRDDLERTRQLLINMDAPEHTVVRQLVTAVFAPATVRRLQASIRDHAKALVERALARESFDVVADIAAELPLLVLTDLLGVPREDRSLMYAWSNNLVGFDDPEYGGGSLDRYKRTYVEALDYARGLANLRRRQPQDDLVSLLVNSESEGRRLTDVEFCNLWLLLVVGGNESTRHFLSGAIQALCEWPDERQRLTAVPDFIRTAIEELLRWVSPIMQFRRTADCDVELEGQPVKEGDKVVLYYVAANRDETVFAAPDALDLGRERNPHLAFGVGPHFCLGARLARAEATALLTALLPHLASLQLTGPIVRLASNFMNGIKAMPACFVPCRRSTSTTFAG